MTGYPQRAPSLLLGLLAAFMTVMVLLGTSEAVAQEVIATSNQNSSIELIGQTPYVAADGTFETELSWTGPSGEGVTLSATVWSPIQAESDIFSEPSIVHNRQAARPLSEIPRTESGALSYRIDIRSFRDAADERIFLEFPGVYPVTIEIRDADGELARLRTNLIRLPTDVADSALFPISVVLSVSSADGLELSEAIDLLEAHPTLPLTVLLENGLLPQLQSDPILAARLAIALGGRTVVAGPQLNLDPSALANIGQPQFYLDALEQTRSDFRDVGLNLDPSILPLDTGITRPGATMLSSAGIDVVLDLHTSAGSLGSITSDAGALTVVRVDDEHTAGLNIGATTPQRAGGAIQRAHRLLALLAVRYQTDRSPVILGGGGLRNADLQALEVVLGSLDQGGMMGAISINQAALSSRTLPFRPQENPDQNLEDIVEPISRIQSLLDTYSAFRVTGGPSPEGIQVRVIEGLSRDLNPDARSDSMITITQDLEQQFDVISLPDGPAITLAAQKSAIPLTVTNSSSGTRTIRLQFQSDRIGVLEHDRLYEVESGKSQIEINIEAHSLGVSSLLVSVYTPDGSRELATTRFEIRSTAIPGLGYALSGTALFFLLVWWFRSIRRSRSEAKPRGPAPAS